MVSRLIFIFLLVESCSSVVDIACVVDCIATYVLVRFVKVRANE